MRSAKNWSWILALACVLMLAAGCSSSDRIQLQSFGMISALTLLVVEKSKEIAILKSLGLPARSIRLMFMLQGVFIGALGTALGLGLGLLVSYVLDTFPLIEIPPGVYPGSDRVPVLVAWQDLLWVVGGTMAVCLGATLFPAHKAVALNPTDGLRHD